jgi:tRNA(Ile)-lysidine synthase
LLVLARASDFDVTAVHVDHGLRSGSAAEADVVRAAAERFGARFRAERVAVATGPNLEARARAARYAALPPGVLTGHTADDQAETVLLNLLRGAGLDGLSGMRPQGHPLLGLRRAETRALCAELDLVPVEDPTNADPAHLRNRVRHELVPLLAEMAGRDPVPILVRQAGILREEAAYLDAQAGVLDPTDARAVAASPPAVARRALRGWLRDGTDHPPDAAAVERVLAVARMEAQACQLNDGRRVSRTRGRLGLDPA